MREELFGPLGALGKQIKIGADNFTVIGVEQQKGSSGIGQSADNSLYIPYSVFLKKYGSRRSITLQVRASSGETIQTTEDEVRMILRARHKLKPQRRTISTCSPAVPSRNHRRDHRHDRGGHHPITLVGLVVSGIVVMNIMLVTVTERTVEVGMRKAVGARADILLQFLVESALLATRKGGSDWDWRFLPSSRAWPGSHEDHDGLRPARPFHQRRVGMLSGIYGVPASS